MYITIDIGGTKGRIALFAGFNKKTLLNIVYTTIQDDFENDLKKVFNGIDSLSMGKQLDAIAIGIAGSINEKANGIMNSGTLKTWENKDLIKLFKDKYSCKVMIANDTFMAGFAEGIFGEIKEDFLYINWGTGIGGCLVNFFEDRAFEIRPTELGHQIIIEDGEQCKCGQKGCIDAYVGGKGIEKIYKKKAVELSEEEWMEVVKRFALGIMNAIVVYPVKYVVLGGGIAINQPSRVKEVEKYIKENLKIVTVPQIKQSTFRDNTALYGGLEYIKCHIID
jgi:predicted NBD/HSP70 family sugar kinase